MMLTHLIKDKGSIAGAAGFSLDQGTLHFFRAKTVILCTGAGGFKPNGFPICDLTHDGSIMAWRIGAKITGKEWNDGHRGNLEHPASVYDQWQGVLGQNPSVENTNIRHDLGVEQNYTVYTQGPSHEKSHGHPGRRLAESGGPFRPKGIDFSGPRPRPFQGSDHGKKGHHPPPGMGGIPSGGASAGMSIHKSEGLVPYDETGKSNIPGLYAAGDALGSHMCGGIYTQIGSSLAGSAVQGAIAGQAAAGYAKNRPLPEISNTQKSELRQEILAPLKRKRGYSPAWITQNRI